MSTEVGEIREIDCPHNGPNRITVTADGALVHCDALAIFQASDGKDGRRCFKLHHRAPEGCPFPAAPIQQEG